MTKNMFAKVVSSLSILSLVLSGFVPIIANATTVINPIDCPAFQTVTVVSDETTLADGSASVETYVHGSWDSISGAEWIWKTTQVQNPTTDEYVEFTKTFSVPGTSITSASIEIAADNEFVLEVNGDPIANENDEDNFTSTQTYDITASIDAGENNDIEVTVKNRALANSDYTTNPAGLIYKITINGVDCGEPSVTLTKTALVDGDHITYTIEWEVTGGNVDDLVITDVVPRWADLLIPTVASNPAADSTTNPVTPHLTPATTEGTHPGDADRTITWDFNGENAGASGTVSFKVEAWTTKTCELANTASAAFTYGNDDDKVTSNTTSNAVGGEDCGDDGDDNDGGSIKICKIVLDTAGNVVAGDATHTFTIPFLSDADYEGPETGDPADVVFDTPLALENVFGDVQGECETVTGLDFGRYYYGQEQISSGATWGTVLYNDQVSMTVDSLSDLHVFNSDLAPQNDNWDGVINIDQAHPTRTLIVSNQLEDACPNLAEVQNFGADCTPGNGDDTATIHATKVVCDAESKLPNWGNGAGPDINATTASDWVADHPGCSIVPWTFQWAPNDTDNPGDNTTGTPAGWYSFSDSISIPAPTNPTYVWVRENVDTSYIPFTGQNTTEDVSAELHCNIDHLNYDNYDRVDNMVNGEHYYCVGFNVLVRQPEPNVCSAEEAATELISNGSFETPIVTNSALWDIVASGTNGVVWLASWINPIGAPLIANLELQENGLFAGGASAGTQWTELDSDWDGPSGSSSGEAGAVEISQTVTTEVGVDYKVSYDFSARPNTAAGENKLEVLIDGVVVDTIGPTAGAGSTSWTSDSYTFTATATSHVVSFRDAGTSNNSIGTFLDNVSVKCLEDDNGNDTADITVVKLTVSEADDTFHFNGLDGNDGFDLTTANGTAEQTFQVFADDDGEVYDITEDVPGGWTLDSSVCDYEYSQAEGAPIDDGEQVTVYPGDEVTCTFTNSKDNEGPTTSQNTTVVTGDTSAGENLLGWLFNRDLSTQSPFVFNTDAASIGTGSLFVQPITNTINGNSDKFIGELFLLTPMAGVEDISYDFQIGAPDATAEEQFYMSVYANFGESAGTKYYDCRYNVVPVIGATGSFTTVTFDPDLTYPVTQHGTSPHACPGSPADMDLSSPGSTIRAIALNVGDTSGSDTGVSGYLDKVVTVITTGLNTHTETYDFEPATPNITEDDGPSSSTSSGSSRRSRGSVLGATDICSWDSSYMRRGWGGNIAADVMKVQQDLLNAHEGNNLKVDGVYGPMTEAAVKAFQAKYAAEILAPWGISAPTGHFYLSSLHQAQKLLCPTEEDALPPLINWSQNPAVAR